MDAEFTSFLGDNNFLALDGFIDAKAVLKIESFNPAGSIKFKTALGLIESAEALPDFNREKILVESSSGNLGVSLSMICASRGYRFLCVVDPNTNPQNIAIMKAMGADVFTVEQLDENGGFLGTRIRYIKSLLGRDGKYIWLNQYENPANPAIHARTTAAAISAEFAKIDYLFVGVGTSGTLSGCAEYFGRERPEVKIIGVDSIGSITFGLPPGKRFIPGLGSSQPPKLFKPSGLHAMIAIPEATTIAMCREMARNHGLLLGGSSGTVLSAVRAWNSHFQKSDVVIAIAPDGGERYISTIFNDDWVRQRFGAIPATANAQSNNEVIWTQLSGAREARTSYV